jgi:hypothetical protein
MPHAVNGVYVQISKRAGLRYLLAYALTHQSSHQWISAIALLMQRGGHAHD